MSNVPVEVPVAQSVSTVSVTSAAGSAGTALASARTTSIQIRNLSRNQNVQYKVGSGSWNTLSADRNSGRIDVDLNATSVVLRQEIGSVASSVEVTSDVVASGGAAGAATVGGTVPVGSSRALTAADDGSTIECTGTLTLTVPEGLPAGFGCAIIPSGTTSIARSGTTLLNGAGTTLTRAAASNAMFAIVARGSAANSYVVTGS